jgi:FkbM family methyltransferase
VARHRPVSARRLARLQDQRIGIVLDVGANKGQYATDLRDAGYRGRILSFEPLDAVFPILADAAATDPAWTTFQIALSDAEGEADLYVAANTASSSLRPMLPLHERVEPKAAIVGKETIRLARLDDVLSPADLDAPVLLKVDVQGHELEVLRGATRTLGMVALLELEVSVRPLYDRAPLLQDVLEVTRSLGFELVYLEPGFYDPRDGTVLQFDAFLVPQASCGAK